VAIIQVAEPLQPKLFEKDSTGCQQSKMQKTLSEDAELSKDLHPDHMHQQQSSSQYHCRGPLHNGVWTW
jgi:hypothetical protein